ncbi:hypothetical protein [Butyrivibrio proteoclasticus]|uniref:hypothetical protein n=1 Tax=Butyrivibrio proteoclasticus TaxID=43305 RepID=UPI000479C56C|nr:hypothetical protein [Butyrivibrio proteoclasticus]
MKKKIVGMMLATSMIMTALTACGEEMNDDTTPSGAISTENDGDGYEGSDSASTEKTEKSESIESSSSDAEAGSSEDAEASEDSSNESVEIKGLYADFVDGKAKVKYAGKADLYQELAEVLTVGESYTLQEICDALENAGEYGTDPDLTFTVIDCGQDGAEELAVEIGLSAMYHLNMVIKEINGELVICYDEGSSDKHSVDINTDGTIEATQFSAANIHSYDYAFINADGEYVFYYGYTETYGIVDDSYDIYQGDTKISIPVDNLEKDNIAVLEYYYEQDYKTRDYFFSFYSFDLEDNWKVIPREENSEDISTIMERFESAGYKTLTSEEVETTLALRAKEVGYPN